MYKKYNRDRCVICKASFETLYTLQSFPVSLHSPKNTSLSDDIYTDLTISRCINCSCVQLSGDLLKIHGGDDSNPDIKETDIWLRHNKQFSSFIMHTVPSSILEIGSISPLYKHILQFDENINYFCLNALRKTYFIPSISYLHGNAETFNYIGFSTIIMCHSFQELYNPRYFIEKVSNSNVGNIFLSIPNMDNMLSQRDPNIINTKNTYFINKMFIEWMFGQYNYRLQSYYEFENHSLFFYFKLNNPSVSFQLSLENNRAIGDSIRDIHLNTK